MNVRMQRGFRVKRCSIKKNENPRDHRQWMEKMRHHRRPTKWCSFRWPIRTNLMNWMLFTWHFLFFVHCFVCVTDCLISLCSSPIYNAPMCDWRELIAAAFYFAAFFSAGTKFWQIEVNPQNSQKLELAKFSCYTVTSANLFITRK